MASSFRLLLLFIWVVGGVELLIRVIVVAEIIPILVATGVLFTVKVELEAED